MRAAPAVSVVIVFLFLFQGCAGTGGPRKERVKSDVGAVFVLSGAAAGAYAGASISGDDGAAAGGVYWLILSLFPDDDEEAEAPYEPDDSLLFPEAGER